MQRGKRKRAAWALTDDSGGRFGNSAELGVGSLRLCFNLGVLACWTLLWPELLDWREAAADRGQHLPSQAASDQDWPSILQKVRTNALAYTDQLPNFICRQTTRRFIRSMAGRGLGWRKTGSFVAALSFYDKKEHYEILTVNGKPADKSTMTNSHVGGLSTSGEFGSALQSLFAPQTRSIFRKEGVKKIHKMKTLCLSFEVPQERSRRSISYNKQTIVTAYRGRCWIDPISYQVVRLEKNAVDIPEDFPVTRFDMSIDYSPFTISNRRHWLPKQAEIWLNYRVPGRFALQLHTKNRISFEGYRRFGAGVKLMTDE